MSVVTIGPLTPRKTRSSGQAQYLGVICFSSVDQEEAMRSSLPSKVIDPYFTLAAPGPFPLRPLPV